MALSERWNRLVRWAFGGAFERRFALLENAVDKLHERVVGYGRGSVDSLLFVDTADWCGKRHKFVTNVRVIDKCGTRRLNVLVDSLDDVAIRAAVAAKAGGK